MKSFDALGGEDKAAPARHRDGRRHRRARQTRRRRARTAALWPRAPLTTRRRSQGHLVRHLQESAMGGGQFGARVVNMSFAGPTDPLLHRMLAAAYEKGIVLIAAAGNAGPNSAPLYPAADADVIAVTATDMRDGALQAWPIEASSSRSPHPALMCSRWRRRILSGHDRNVGCRRRGQRALRRLLLELKPSLKPADVRDHPDDTGQAAGATAANSRISAPDLPTPIAR